ncbi:hypothetical protein BU26DRAFT_540568, partial [Trematosphaeria pertusa]
MDKATQALARGVPDGVPESYRALADHSGVPYATIFYRKNGRRSIEEKAQSQQYFTPWEEEALVKFLLQISDLRQPVQVKYIPALAFCLKAFERRYLKVEARRVSALEWNRHKKNTYGKIIH